jgi:hypothetical protein
VLQGCTLRLHPVTCEMKSRIETVCSDEETETTFIDARTASSGKTVFRAPCSCRDDAAAEILFSMTSPRKVLIKEFNFILD